MTLKQEVERGWMVQSPIASRHTAVSGCDQGMAEGPAAGEGKTLMFVCSEMPMVPRETWVLPYTNRTQCQKLMSQNLNIILFAPFLKFLQVYKFRKNHLFLHRTLPPIHVVAEPLTIISAQRQDLNSPVCISRQWWEEELPSQFHWPPHGQTLLKVRHNPTELSLSQ